MACKWWMLINLWCKQQYAIFNSETTGDLTKVTGDSKALFLPSLCIQLKRFLFLDGAFVLQMLLFQSLTVEIGLNSVVMIYWNFGKLSSLTTPKFHARRFNYIVVTRKNKRIKKSISSLSAKICSPTIRDVIFLYVRCTTISKNWNHLNCSFYPSSNPPFNFCRFSNFLVHTKLGHAIFVVKLCRLVHSKVCDV